MRLKLFESELKVMEVLWREGAVTAKRVVEALEKQVGWNKNTTYTVIKKCVDKGAIAREEPGFVCRPLITQEEVRRQETDALIDRLYDKENERDVFKPGVRATCCACMKTSPSIMTTGMLTSIILKSIGM